MTVEVQKPTAETLEKLDVGSWPVWTCKASEFDWQYDEKETCYILEGEVEVTFKEGKANFQKGDLVVFSEGLSCRWKIIKAVKKHYKFG
jgi:uncharacterized cupin superfamily protein